MNSWGLFNLECLYLYVNNFSRGISKDLRWKWNESVTIETVFYFSASLQLYHIFKDVNLIITKIQRHYVKEKISK